MKNNKQSWKCKLEGCLNVRPINESTCSPEHRIAYRREYQRQWWHKKGKFLPSAKKPKQRDREKWNAYQRAYYLRKKII